jgi:hypothetical protein
MVDFATWFCEQNGSANGTFGFCVGTAAQGRKHGIGKFGVTTSLTNSVSVINVWDLLTYRSVGTANANQLDSTGINNGLVECLLRQNGAFAGGGGNGPGCGANGFPMTPPGVCCIGASQNGTGNLIIGDIAEIIVYKQCLANIDIVNVEAYLASKYALTVTRRPKYAAEAFDGWTVNTATDMILDKGAPGSFDANAAYGPSFIYDGGVYYMVYAGLDAANVNAIGLATGPSLRSLTKYGRILQKSGAGWDSAYISGDRLFKDPVSGKWFLFYFGSNAPGFEQPPAHIGVSGPQNTPYGPWTNAAGPIITTGGVGAWDEIILYRPYVFYKAPTYYLYYNAHGTGAPAPEKIGLATATAIAGPWTKHASNPIISPVGGTDASRIGDGVVLEIDPGKYVMHYFGGANPSVGEVYLAESTDLVAWTKYTGGIYVRVPGMPNCVRLDVSLVNGVYEGACDDGDVAAGKGHTFVATLKYGP